MLGGQGSLPIFYLLLLQAEMERTLREAYSKLGLPWVDAGPTTLSRAAFLLYEFGNNGLQIARFLRSVMGPLDGKVTEEHSQNLAFTGALPSLTSTEETLAAPSSAVGEGERVVIIDVGSFFTKAGWASDATPAVTFPSVAEDGSRPVDRGLSSWRKSTQVFLRCSERLERFRILGKKSLHCVEHRTVTLPRYYLCSTQDTQRPQS